MKELKNLKKNTIKAVGRVAAEFKFATDFKDELEVITRSEPDKAKREVKRALRILRWVGRAERRVDQSEGRILSNLTELGKILPTNLKTQEETLHQQLEVAEKELIRLASTFLGKLKGELETIKTDEALLIRYQKNPEQAKHIHAHLRVFLNETKKDVDNLLRWVSSTEQILRKIKGFEETLEQLSEG